ncbi:hypothetical protein [Streptomyces sp. CC224B]|uniref:hypothetical protein n=1 Tax=Streptomyces sp. CC224B TaxID=3044571 RepID=UPI0024A94D69|nr:hypothetical protein [Streptomyces sp. CC224B]
MSTPKQARTHRRKANPGDRTRNVNACRVEASWNDRPDKPATLKTSDRKRARRLARQWAAEGAYVIVQEHTGWDTWRTVTEIDGPALVAAQQRAAAEEHRRMEEQQHAAAKAEAARRAASGRAEGTRADLARLMRRPPVAREQCGRRDARHVTGAQR